MPKRKPATAKPRVTISALRGQITNYHTLLSRRKEMLQEAAAREGALHAVLDSVSTTLWSTERSVRMAVDTLRAHGAAATAAALVSCGDMCRADYDKVRLALAPEPEREAERPQAKAVDEEIPF